MKKYLNFIAGQWVAARSGKTYQNTNPADTRDVVAEYSAGAREEAQDAIQAAAKAFPGWAATSAVVRGRILSKTSQILETRKSELSELLTRDQQRAIDVYFINELKRLGSDFPYEQFCDITA